MTNTTFKTTKITRLLTEEERLRFEMAERHEESLACDSAPYTIEDAQREGQWILAVGPFSECFDKCGQSLAAN